LVAEPTRLPAAVERMGARTELAERVKLEEAVDRRCPQLRGERIACST